MFLDWIAQLRLLDHDPQTNILGSLPLSVRRSIVTDINTYLQSSGKQEGTFSSPAHVKWYMEVVGQGFALPLEDMTITNEAITIYSHWLLEPGRRPAAVAGLEQEFFQIIFQHFSMLFQPRVFRSSTVRDIPQFLSSSASPDLRQDTAFSASNATTTTTNTTNTTTNAANAANASHPAPPTSASSSTAPSPTAAIPSNFKLTVLPVQAYSGGVLPFTMPTYTPSGPSSVASAPPPPPPPPPLPQRQPEHDAVASSSTSNGPAASSNTALKDTLAPLVQRHIELCKRTLAVITTAARTLPLSDDTWTTLLKVMLGITDYLLKEPGGETPVPGVKNISDELCVPLLRVLFELWLRSKTDQVSMWDMLKKCFIRWTHRPPVIQYWSTVSLALTQRIVHQLYGAEEGTDMVILAGDVSHVKLDLPDAFVKHAWHRIMYLLPSPVSLPPLNFHLAMKGIGDMVDVLNRVGLRPSVASTAVFPTYAAPTSVGIDAVWTSTAPPDGNTLLNMFGAMLFDACAVASDVGNLERQHGCAEAISTLCKIFSRPQRRHVFLRTYLERFYAALCLCLKSDTCLPTILLNGMSLFAADLRGIRILVPDVVSAIKMVIPKVKLDVHSLNVPLDTLRLAALKILATIMCVPNYYEAVTLKPGWEWDIQNATEPPMSDQEELVTKLIRALYHSDQQSDDVNRPYTNLKFYLLELLLMAFQTETSSYNMRYILHLINVYVAEDVPFCPGLVGVVVKFIQDKILTMQLPSDVSLVAFDVLMEFVDLYDYVKRDSKNIARELVLALGRYVDSLINARRLVHSYPLIVQAYDCMIKWVLVSQWIVEDKDCYQAVIATLSKGITVMERMADQIPPTAEKKKRRDTAFPPPKQLFQLQPKTSKASSSAGSASAGSSTASSPSPLSPTDAHAPHPLHHGPPTSHHAHPHAAPHTHANNAHPHHPQARIMHRKEEMAVRMAAEYCMAQFVNHLGRPAFRNNDHPSQSDFWVAHIERKLRDHRQACKPPSGASSVSTSAVSTPGSDQSNTTSTQIASFVASVAGDSSSTFDYVRYFMLDNKMILTIVDTANFCASHHYRRQKGANSQNDLLNPIPALVATLRDTTGKYIWSMDARFVDPRRKTPVKSQSQSDAPANVQHAPFAPHSATHPLPSTASNSSTSSPRTLLSTSNTSLTVSPSQLTPADHMEYFQDHHHDTNANVNVNATNVQSTTTHHGPHHHSSTRSSHLSRSKRSNTQITVTPVPVAAAGHQDAIPSLNTIFAKDTDNWKQWRAIVQLSSQQEKAEANAFKAHPDKPANEYNVAPPQRHVDTDSALAFRLLLSEIGYLLPQNRHRITPLRLTDNLLSQLEMLDNLNDRECISITAYYAASGDTSWPDLIETPPPLNPAFNQFLNCVGWPVDLQRHNNFKGKLDASVCQTTPYFADRNIEFIVHVPYFLSQPSASEQTAMQQPQSQPQLPPRPATQAAQAPQAPHAPHGSNSNTSRSSSLVHLDANATVTMIHEHVTSDDFVCVIWIENLVNYTNLAKRIKASLANSKLMVYLFIHPMPNTANGLFWIRVLVPPFGNTPSSIMASQRLQENALIFGPLVDGMVVGRHALGAMVRSTAISAHQACRVVTETYTRPYVIRKQFIEELAVRHRTKLSLSEFYTEIFSEKECS